VPEVWLRANDGVATYSAFIDLRDQSIGTTSSASASVIELSQNVFLLVMVFTASNSGSGFSQLRTSDGAENGTSKLGLGETIKIKKAVFHESAATLTLDTFGALAGSCFAIGAHNLWSSGATIAFGSNQNLFPNPANPVGADWSTVGGPTIVSGGAFLTVFTNANSNGGYIELPTLAGGTYRFEVDVQLQATAGVSTVRISDGAFAFDGGLANETALTGNRLVLEFVAPSDTVTVYLRHSVAASSEWDSFVFELVASPPISLTDDSPIMYFFDDQTADEWTVTISGGALPEVGVVRVGDPLVFERARYGGASPAAMNRATELVGNISRTGELLGRSKRRTILAESISWPRLTYDWVRANLDGPTGVIQSLEADSAFLAWRPSHNNDVAYIMRGSTGKPTATSVVDLWSFSIDGEVYAYE